MAAATRPDDSAATSDRGGLEFGRFLLYGLALASLAAGIIHCSAALDHAHENLPWHAGLFAASAAAQLAWAGVIVRRSSRRWLLAGLVVNFALVAAWVLSRSTGVPVIPGAQDVEPLGFKDVTTAFFELAVVIGVGLFAAVPLAIRRLRLPAGRLAFEAMLTAVLVLVFFGLSQTPHSHSHDHGHAHGEEALLSSNSDHHHGDGEGHHHGGPEEAGEAHEAAAGHDRGHRTGTDATVESDSTAAHEHDNDHVHDAGHEHPAGDMTDHDHNDGDHPHDVALAAADSHAGHHHDAPESPSSGTSPSAGHGHSHVDSAPAGSGHHHDEPDQSAAPPPGREQEGHDHSTQPSGGSEGHDHGGGADSSPSEGGHDHNGGHDHGGGEDPAAEELIAKAFFAFLNTITKAAGLGPV